MGFGIVNTAHAKMAETNDDKANDTAWPIAEIVQNIQAAHDKQMESFMQSNEIMLEQIVIADMANNDKQEIIPNNLRNHH